MCGARDDPFDVDRVEKIEDDEKFVLSSQQRGNRVTTLFDQAFDDAKAVRCSDYVFSRGLVFDDIRRRESTHIRLEELPVNLVVHDRDEDGDQIEFSIEWAKALTGSAGLQATDVVLAMSDGSAKNGCGGAGFVSCVLSAYHRIDHRVLIKHEMSNESLRSLGIFAEAWFKAIAVSRRASIEHCELTGAIWTMQDNTSLHGRKLLIICVDSLSVLRWLAGTQRIEGAAEAEKAAEFHRRVCALDEFGIVVHLVWVKAHRGHPMNEIADWLAKCAMENMRMTNRWRGWQHIYDRREWDNISAAAVRRSTMKSAIRRMHADWEETKRLKRERNDQSLLSSNLVRWDIKPHWAYAEERRRLTWKEWGILNSMRCGHMKLNAQSKSLRGEQTLCDACGEDETLEHVLFECPAYEQTRADWWRRLQDDLRGTRELEGWDRSRNTSRLRRLLFPHQERLRMIDDAQEREKWIAKRIDRIKQLIMFLKRTGRWAESEDTSYIPL